MPEKLMHKPDKKRVKKASKKSQIYEAWILYVGTYPPRECGIATFTEDLVMAMDDLLMPKVVSKIMAMNLNSVTQYNYPKKVILQASQDCEQDYLDAAAKINEMERITVVNVQHEFGIFGGEYGSHLLKFIDAVNKPVVVTFHTVLPGPNESLKKIVQQISHRVSSVVTMTFSSRDILLRDYALDPEKIAVIPHGIHHRPYVSSKSAKKTLGFSGRTVLSTFGLINKGKGIEYVLEAMPEVVKQHPKLLYIILGATHPVVLKQEGEAYRNSLVQRVLDLGLARNVKFYNQYFSLDKLLHFLEATDVYLSTSLDPNQAVSGTLSYSLGAGRPVVSTAFAQAREDVTEDVGLLVDFRNKEAYAHALLDILRDEERRIQLGKAAYFKTRRMTWSNVAIEYGRLFSKYSPALAIIDEQKVLPKIRLNHLERMTDEFGMFQFAKLTTPDPASGYTLDDNARALLFVSSYRNRLVQDHKSEANSEHKRITLRLAGVYLDFIEFVARPDGYFANYVNTEKVLDDKLNQQGSFDDTNGRTLHALAVAATASGLSKKVQKRALGLVERSLQLEVSLTHSRAVAFYVKGLAILIAAKKEIPGIALDELINMNCNKLLEWYRENSTADWQWFEKHLTYSNAVLPEALLMGYQAIGNTEYLEIGKQTLDFLIKESFIDGMYVPVGQEGWYVKDGHRHVFDQQPEDVAAMISALEVAYEITGDLRYRNLKQQAFNWFLGDNMLHQVVYDRITGGCYDGVSEKNINLNQGAESTVSYLISRISF